ncbi:Na+/H+ antiporter subunit G [candidate division WOR-3 bacterium]|nr:Na+/H+ antiporter subunit G [candidate division WOR-3 bacterium]
MSDIIGFIIICIGIAFNFFGCLGLLRLPDVYNRLQAATKCVTVGTWGILIGVCVISGLNSLGVKALLAVILIFFTSATASHALARGAHKFGIKLWKKSVCDKYEEKSKVKNQNAK